MVAHSVLLHSVQSDLESVGFNSDRAGAYPCHGRLLRLRGGLCNSLFLGRLCPIPIEYSFGHPFVARALNS